jgi:hypothetical protein
MTQIAYIGREESIDWQRTWIWLAILLFIVGFWCGVAALGHLVAG